MENRIKRKGSQKTRRAVLAGALAVSMVFGSLVTNGWMPSYAEDTLSALGLNEKGNAARTLNAKGADYTVTMAYGEKAAIPDGTALQVQEILPDATEYAEYKQSAADQLEAAEEQVEEKEANIVYERYFDIGLSADEKDIETQAPVAVEFAFKDAQALTADQDLSIVHFTNEGVEVLEGAASFAKNHKGMEKVSFDADSFSVYGIVGIEAEKASDENAADAEEKTAAQNADEAAAEKAGSKSADQAEAAAEEKSETANTTTGLIKTALSAIKEKAEAEAASSDNTANTDAVEAQEEKAENSAAAIDRKSVKDGTASSASTEAENADAQDSEKTDNAAAADADKEKATTDPAAAENADPENQGSENPDQADPDGAVENVTDETTSDEESAPVAGAIKSTLNAVKLGAGNTVYTITVTGGKINKSGTDSLMVTGQTKKGATHTWESSDDSVVKVTGTDQNATFTAKGAGTATVTHKYGKNNKDMAKESFTVTVTASSTVTESSISLDQESVSIAKEESTEVKVTMEGCSVSAPDVTTSDTSVATADYENRTITITGIAAGSATITVSGTAEDGYTDPNPQTIQVTVTDSGQVSEEDSSAQQSQQSSTSDPIVTVKDTGHMKKLSDYHVVVEDADSDYTGEADLLKAYHIYLADSEGNEVPASVLKHGGEHLNLQVTLTYQNLPDWFDTASEAKKIRHYKNKTDRTE